MMKNAIYEHVEENNDEFKRNFREGKNKKDNISDDLLIEQLFFQSKLFPLRKK